MPTAGYSIEIETVRLDADGQVIAEVSLDNPGINELVAQVITYPVDLKVIPRDGLEDPSDVTWYAQTAEGRVLARFGTGNSQSKDGEDVEPDDGGTGSVDPPTSAAVDRKPIAQMWCS